MTDLIQQCLVVAAGLCLNAPATVTLETGSLWTGARIAMPAGSILSVLRTDNIAYPDRRRMARYCAGRGSCIFYHVYCEEKPAEANCAIEYNERGDTHNRRIEVRSPDALKLQTLLRETKLVSRHGRLVPLANLNRKASTPIPPFCRPGSDRNCNYRLGGARPALWR